MGKYVEHLFYIRMKKTNCKSPKK